MEITFEVGDIVKVKGSSIVMTINNKKERQGTNKDSYECLWFVERVLHRDTFAGPTLEPAEALK